MWIVHKHQLKDRLKKIRASYILSTRPLSIKIQMG